MLVKEGLTMRKQRTFTAEFKREVVEELLSGTTRPAQICRRYSISSGLLPMIEETEEHSGIEVDAVIGDGAYGTGDNRAECAKSVAFIFGKCHDVFLHINPPKLIIKKIYHIPYDITRLT